MYLLDTNVCIQYLNGNAQIQQRLLSCERSQISTCEIVRFELYYGAFSSRRALENVALLNTFFEPLIVFPFDAAAAIKCGEIRSQLKRQGQPIGPYDLQIAAIALSRNLVLVTHNVREFCRVEGLRWEDWEG